VPRPNRRRPTGVSGTCEKRGELCDQTADLVILGGGSGGYAAASAPRTRQSVVLIEKDKLGGTCLHYGCIPTKALLHAAEIADNSRESEQFGVKTTFAGIDIDGVHKYKDGVVTRLYKGLQGIFKAARSPQSRVRAGWSPRPRSKSTASGTRASTSSSPPARCPSRCRPADRRQPGHLLQRCADASTGFPPRW